MSLWQMDSAPPLVHLCLKVLSPKLQQLLETLDIHDSTPLTECRLMHFGFASRLLVCHLMRGVQLHHTRGGTIHANRQAYPAQHTLLQHDSRILHSRCIPGNKHGEKTH